MASDAHAWEYSVAPEALGDKGVDLWRVRLPEFHTQAAALFANLTPDEANRGSRFVFENDRLDFVVGRSILRILLGGYLGVPARSVEIQAGPRGKPILSQLYEKTRLNFNVSHSHGLCVLAFRGNGGIGVDIERVRDGVAVLDIATRFFAPEESAYLRGLAKDRQRTGFFSLWTQKEAFVKGLGEGLHVSLNEFRVDPNCSQGPFVTSQDNTPWRIYTFEPAEEYVGSLATQGRQDLTIRYLEYRK